MTTPAPPTATLAAWLEQQLAADEALATAATAGPWEAVRVPFRETASLSIKQDDRVLALVGWEKEEPVRAPADAVHIAAQDPAQTLRRVAAIRQVLALHEDCDCEREVGPLIFDAEPEITAGTDAFGGLVISRSIGTQQVGECPTVLALASQYADRDGYRAEEWA